MMHVQVLRMGKVLHQYALCDFDAADEFLGAMHPALLEVHAYMHMHMHLVNACVIWHT
tara:strand:- start:561 stop:734 length:174 start_codon:yes stop_codon:yes gene_type:complete